jgi:general stress protein YciG
MERKTQSSGFASMDRRKQREIARKGGMAAHRKGVAHEFTAEEARNAGRKGGQNVSMNRSHMIEIGRLGGRRSAERRRNRMSQVGGGTPAVSQIGEEESSMAAVGAESPGTGEEEEAEAEGLSVRNATTGGESVQPGGWETGLRHTA